MSARDCIFWASSVVGRRLIGTLFDETSPEGRHAVSDDIAAIEVSEKGFPVVLGVTGARYSLEGLPAPVVEAALARTPLLRRNCGGAWRWSDGGRMTAQRG